MNTDHAAAAPAHEDQAEHAPEHEAESGSFWKSVPGILTACTSLVVALSGLVAGLGQAGIIGSKKADAHAVATASPSPTHTPTSAPLVERDDDGSLRPYYVNSPGDGFSWVRKGPTKDSEGVATLASGTLVRCRDAVPDPDPDTGRTWNLCPDQGGYISARLLKPAR